MHAKTFTSGFSLVELLVVVSIFTIITGVLIANHSRFNSATLLNNLAYEIALSVRTAQAYGTSVRGNSSLGSFKYGYGIHFDNPSAYVIFQDTNNNGRYNSGEDIETFTLSRGHRISDFCRGNNCFSEGEISSLDIVFKRPNPEPKMNNQIDWAFIYVIPSDDTTARREISVSPLGAIQIRNLQVSQP